VCAAVEVASGKRQQGATRGPVAVAVAVAPSSALAAKAVAEIADSGVQAQEWLLLLDVGCWELRVVHLEHIQGHGRYILHLENNRQQTTSPSNQMAARTQFGFFCKLQHVLHFHYKLQKRRTANASAAGPGCYYRLALRAHRPQAGFGAPRYVSRGFRNKKIGSAVPPSAPPGPGFLSAERGRAA
jgi:hypothetical protein